MKRVLMFLLALAMVFGFYVQAHANNLIDLGPDSLGYHLIYDSDLNITWYDYSHPGSSNPGWQEQVNWANSLTVIYNGNPLTGWRLPTTVDGIYVFGYNGLTTAGYNILSSEMGHLYYTELGNKGWADTSGNGPQPGWGLVNTGPFTHLVADGYWSGTRLSIDPLYSSYAAWTFWFHDGEQDKDDTWYYRYYGLAVHDGDVSAPIPEPATMLLLGSGLIGLAGYGKKKFFGK